MNSNLAFYTAPQRTKEFSQTQYIGAIDLLAEAEAQHRTLHEMKAAVVAFYEDTAPGLLDGTKALNDTLTALLGQGEAANQLLRDANAKLNEIEESLIRIEDLLGQGFDLIATRLDESNQLLTEIRNILSAPVATQAEEYLSRAQGFIKDGFYEEGSSDLEKVVELDPGNYVAWYLIGLLQTQAFGDKEGAIRAFAKSDRYSSVRSKTYFAKSQFQQALLSYNVDSDLSAAKKHILQAVEADEANLNAYFFAAELYSELGDLDASAKYLRHCEPYDDSFYLRSHSSDRLQDSGVHNRVFAEQTKEFHKLNKLFLNSLLKQQKLFQKMRDMKFASPSLLSTTENVERLHEAAPADDYLAQRKLFVITQGLANSMKVEAERFASFVANWVGQPRSILKQDLDRIKKKESESFDNRLILAAFALFTIPALWWIGLAIVEIIGAFESGVIEGLFVTLVIVLGTVMVGAVFIVGWGVVTAILGLLLKAIGIVSAKSKGGDAVKRNLEMGKKREDVAAVIHRQIAEFRSDVAKLLPSSATSSD